MKRKVTIGGRETPLSPARVEETFQQLSAAVREEKEKSAQMQQPNGGKTLVDLDPAKLAPNGRNSAMSGGQPRVPSRSSSVYSGISVYGQHQRPQQPMLFQPIPTWAPNQQQTAYHTQQQQQLLWAPQQQQQPPQAYHQQQQHIPPPQPRTVSRSASEMGPPRNSAFVAATLPRKLPSLAMAHAGPPPPSTPTHNHHPPGIRTNGYLTTRAAGPPSVISTRSAAPSSVAPASVEFRHEFNPAEFPRKGSQDEAEEKRSSEGYGSEATQEKGTSTAGPAGSSESVAPVKKKASEEQRFLAKMRVKEERKRELVGWVAVARLGYGHILFGILLVALGLVRLVKMSTWGLGLELVFGILAFITGVLALVGTQKRNFRAAAAHWGLSFALCLLAIFPLTTALLVTVPDTFGSVGAEWRHLFAADNGLYGVEILTAVVVLLEVLVCLGSLVLGCGTAGKVMAGRQRELSANPIPVLADMKLVGPPLPPQIKA